MKISILYHPVSEDARPVEEYARDFKQRHGVDIELLSLETREGAYIAKLYDIVRYPAVLATDDNAVLVKNWQEEHLPLMNEVASYLVR